MVSMQALLETIRRIGSLGQQPTIPPRTYSANRWNFAPYLAFLVLGLGLVFHPILLSELRMMPGDEGDTRLANYILEYSYRWSVDWLTLHPLNLWDPPFYFPVKNVAAYSEILLGSAPIYWLIRLLRVAPDTSLQIWMMLLLSFNFVSMTLLLRNCLRFTGFASALGGFLFAFGSPRFAQIGHQQLFPQFFTPLAFYGLFRSFEPRGMTSKQGIYLFFVCLAAQFWAGYYLGWSLFFVLLLLAIGALCLPRSRKSLLQHLVKHRRSIALAGLLALVLVAPMADHYLKTIREVGPRAFSDAVELVPRLQTWLYLGGASWLYSWQAQSKLFQPVSYELEQHLGIGWITLIVAIVGFWRFQKARGTWAQVAGLGAIATILLITHYPGGFIPWKYVFGVIPGAVAIRAVARVGILMLIPFSIGLGYFAQASSRSAAFLVAAICLFEQGQGYATYDKLQSRRDIDALVAQVRTECAAFYYSRTYEPNSSQISEQYKLQIDAMWASLQTRVPTINGYAGSAPAGWDDLWENRTFDKAAQSRIRKALDHWTSLHHLDPPRVCWIQSAAPQAH
jgi:hypothetical protein